MSRRRIVDVDAVHLGDLRPVPHQEDLGRELDRWIHNYVSADPNPSEDTRARLPLREARVEVRPVPGKSGAYDAIVWMRPWLQLEELTASMRMVARIPQKRG